MKVERASIASPAHKLVFEMMSQRVALSENLFTARFFQFFFSREVATMTPFAKGGRLDAVRARARVRAVF